MARCSHDEHEGSSVRPGPCLQLCLLLRFRCLRKFLLMSLKKSLGFYSRKLRWLFVRPLHFLSLLWVNIFLVSSENDKVTVCLPTGIVWVAFNPSANPEDFLCETDNVLNTRYTLKQWNIRAKNKVGYTASEQRFSRSSPNQMEPTLKSIWPRKPKFFSPRYCIWSAHFQPVCHGNPIKGTLHLLFK